MPLYEVTAPWGQTYEIDTPAEVTNEELFEYIQANRDSLQAIEPEDAGPGVLRGIAGGVSAAGARGAAALTETAQSLPTVYDIMGLRTDERPYEDVKEGFRDVAETEEQIAAEARPEGFWAGAGYDAATALGVMLPSIGAGILTRNPNAALAVMGIPAFGDGYEDAIAKGESKEKALMDGMASVISELGPERAFNIFGKALGKAPMKSFLQEIILAEGGSEIATEQMNILYDAIVNGENQGDALDILKRQGYAGMLGVILGGGIGGATLPARIAAERKEEQRLADLRALEEAPVDQPTGPVPELVGQPTQTGQVELPTTELEPGGRESYWPGGPVQPELGFPEPEVPAPEQPTLPFPDQGGVNPAEPRAIGDARDLFRQAQQAQQAILEAEDTESMWRAWEQDSARIRAQEDALFAEYDARGRLADDDVANFYRRQMQQEYPEWFAQESAQFERDQLREIENELIAEARAEIEGPTPEDQEAIRARHDELLDELSGDTKRWSVLFRPENVPYARGSDRGQWTITDFSPDTGRVVAEFENDNGKLAVTWNIEGGPVERWYGFEDPESGNPTDREIYARDAGGQLDRTKFKKGLAAPAAPRELIKQVNRLARRAVKYGTPDATMKELLKLERSGADIFRGARPIERVLEEEAGNYDEETIRGLQAQSREYVRNSMSSPTTTSVVPAIKEDTSATVETIIEKGDLAKLSRGTALEARAYQVLPDGDIRILQFRPNEELTGYDVYALGVGGKKFNEPRLIAAYGNRIGPTVREQIEALPGDTIADKIDKLTKKRIREQATEEAKKEEQAAAVPTYAQQRGAARSTPARTGDQQPAGEADAEILQQNLLRQLDRLEQTAVPGQRQLTPEEGRTLGEYRGAKQAYFRELTRLLEPFYETDLKKKYGDYGLFIDTASAQDIAEEFDIPVETVEEVFELTKREGTIGRKEAFEELFSSKGNLRPTAKGERQRARAEAIIKSLLDSDLSPQEINGIVLMYGGFLEAFNPDIQAVEDFDVKNLTEIYGGKEAIARDIIDAVRKDAPPSRSLVDRYEVLVDNLQEEFGLFRADAVAMAHDVLQDQLAAEGVRGELPRPATRDEARQLGRTRRAGATPTTAAEELQRLSAGKIRGQQRTKATPGRDVRSPERVDLEDTLAETIFRIRELTEQQAKEKDRPFKELRDELTRLQEEQTKGNKLSEESIARLQRLEDINTKRRSSDLDEVKKATNEAIAEAKALREQAAAEFQQMREEMRRIIPEVMRAQRELDASTVSRYTDRELARPAERAQPAVTLPVPGKRGVFARYEREEEYVDAVREELAKKVTKATPAPSARLTVRETQLGLGMHIEKETRNEPEQGELFARAVQLAANEEWVEQADGPARPSGRSKEERQEVLDLETPDPVDQAVFEEAQVQRTYKWAGKHHATAAKLLRRLWPSRYAGLSGPSQRSVVEREDKLRGKIRSANIASRRHWALARPILKKAGWKRFDKMWERALNYYLEGVSPAYIEQELGVAIPEEALEHLDAWSTARQQVAMLGTGWGAWERKETRGSILNGRAYLHHTAAQTNKTSAAIESQLDTLYDLAVESWDLPKTSEDVSKLTRSGLLRLLNDRTHNIWHRHISIMPGEKAGDRSAENVMVFDNGKVRLVFGPANPGDLPGSVLNKKLRSLKDKDELKAERLRQNDMLQEAVLSGIPKEADYRTAIKSLVESAVTIQETPLGRGRGAVQAIQKQRRLLKSQADLIRDAIPTLRRSLSVEGKADFDKMMEVMGPEYRKMTVTQFLNHMQSKFPEAYDGIQKAHAEVLLNKKLREAINEVTDTETLMSRTMDAVATTAYTSEYLRHVTASLMGSGMAAVKANAGGNWVPLAAKGTALGDSTFATVGSSSFVKASDVYVPPEVHEVVRDIFAQDAGPYQKGGLRAIRRLSSVVKYMKILMSSLAHARNFVSTRLLHWSKNMVGLGATRAKVIGAELSFAQARAALSEGQESRVEKGLSEKAKTLRKWMSDRGVLYDGAQIGAIYDLQQQSLGVVTEKTPDVHFARRAWRRGQYIAEELFRLEDESVKGTAFLMYAAEHLSLTGTPHALLDKALAGKALNEQESSALQTALDKAGELTLDTYPTFSRTAPIIKSLSRNPVFGAFPSFTYEIMRSSWNTMVYAMGLIEAGFSGKLPDGTKVNRAKAMSMGLIRMAGTVALWTAGSAVSQYLAGVVSEAVGWDDDENDNDILSTAAGNLSTRLGLTPYQRKMRSLKKWWARDTLATVSSIDPETGDYRVTMIDYVMPTGGWEGEIVKAAKKIMSAVSTGDKNVVHATISAVGMIPLNLFGNAEVLYGTWLERVTRSGSLREYRDDRFLKRLGNWAQEKIQSDDRYSLLRGDSATLRTTVGAAAGAIVEQAFFPEMLAQAEGLYREAAEFFAEESPTAAQRLDFMADSMAYIAGFKFEDMNFKEDWPVLFKQDMRTLGGADNSMRRALAEKNFESYDEFKAEFDVQNAIRQEAFDQLFYSMQGAKQALGRSRMEIARALKAADANEAVGGISWGMMEKGAYVPPSVKSFADTVLELDIDEGVRKEEVVAKDKETIRQHILWYRDAMREAGYEQSEYE